MVIEEVTTPINILAKLWRLLEEFKERLVLKICPMIYCQ